MFNCFGNSNTVNQSIGEASSSSSSLVCNYRCLSVHYSLSIFINHRGPDVKKTLASIIYYNLQNRGLQVFLDTREFQPGQELEPTITDAIRTSSVHIAIFSKTYAESVWCLKELCLMLETEAEIIPVFYDVRPNDLRWIEKGKYASAFAKHEKKGRFDFKTISDWKAALRMVSNFSGLDLQDPNTFNGNQGELLKSLEDTVSQYLKWLMPLDVARDPVGLDEAIQDFEGFMAREQPNENETVKIVGIVGLGGSGKTTLAKEFYNRKRSSFKGSSFLSDVRDASTRNALPRLQSKILVDVFHVKGCKIDNISEGKGIVRDRLKSSTPRVLIILDDIDHPNKVEALLMKDVLGSGSMIIVTSRDVSALKRSEASPIYKIKKLKPEHARELFCMHAFQQPTPRIGFEELVEKFCKKCGGLPLFLKVMGAHLRAEANNDKDDWEYELEHIHDDILSILDVSYNTLHKEEKQIFLDIACFFVREDKNLAIRVWDTSEGRGSHRLLKNLENKFLVESDDQSRFKMHDHVRDSGRRIAQDESPCRFWNEDQAVNSMKQQKRAIETRGIVAATSKGSLSDDYYYYEFGSSCCQSFYQPPPEEIEMSALKLFVVKGDCFDEQFGKRSKNLIWLRWFDCPYTNISPWLMSMRDLTVLQLFGGNLKEWQLCDEQVRLRELKIRDTKLCEISIPQYVCPRLEHLDLGENRCLIEVKHLPTKLVKLSFRRCKRLKKISAILDLTNLQVFDISDCCELQELPNLQHLSSLEQLDASNCNKLQNIQGLEHLAKLRFLNISGCSELHELPDLQHLSSLETFNAFDCNKLQNIQGLEHLAKLRCLDASGCSQLLELPNLQYLSSLEKLEVPNCSKMQNIRGLEHLAELQFLDVSGCSELHELPNLQHLSSLETLYVSNLQNIQDLEHLSKLRCLKVSGCSELRELPNLQHLSSLETLHVSRCSKLQNIQGLEHLTKLGYLDVSECSELHELPNLQHLSSLESLFASNCSNLRNIEGLEHLAKFRQLNVSCSDLLELSNLQHLSSLEELWVSKLQNIQGLEHLPTLRKLEVIVWSELRDLLDLQHLSSLQSLDVSICSKLQNIQGLEHLTKLRYLGISWCSELHELPILQHLSSLEALYVSCCSKLQNIQGLEHPAKLRTLEVSGCSELRDLSNLQHVSSLESLDVSNCTKLQNMQGLEHLTNLRYLDVSGCLELHELPNLQHLSSLEKQYVSSCSKLQNIRGLEHLPKLRCLDVSGCPELHELPDLQHLSSFKMFRCL